MALSEEQQEWLAAQAEDLAQRISGLARRHHELIDEHADLQLRLPVSRPAGIDHRVRARLTSLLCRGTGWQRCQGQAALSAT